jgi:hypothetical protein
VNTISQLVLAFPGTGAVDCYRRVILSDRDVLCGDGDARSFFRCKAFRREVRARDKRDFVAPSEMPARSAVSFIDPSFN